MSLHLLRMELDKPNLMRFARTHHLLARRADDLGYLLHACLAALLGEHAPKPFYLDVQRGVLFGYTRVDKQALDEYARAFADPAAFNAMKPDSLATKPMPENWPIGKRVRLFVRFCPIARKDDVEKDVFLRAIERWTQAGENPNTKPERPGVYQEWLARQLAGQGLQIEQISLSGMRAQVAMQRRSRGGSKTELRVVERPEAEAEIVARVTDGLRFNALLARGIGRHRAFGFGMIRINPA